MLLKYSLPMFNTADAPVADAPVVDPALVVDPAPEDAPEPEPVVKDEPAKKPWFMDRIAQESERARRESERATAAERRAAEAEALAERLRAGKEPPAVETRKTEPQTDRQAEVRAEAARMRFVEDTVEVRNTGLSQYGAAFNETLNVLSAVGATTDDFIADVLAVDKSKAHILLSTIAKDPERAVALAGMTSRQRIAELARMSVAAAAPKADPVIETRVAAPKTVSKAPAPAPRVEPSSSKVVNWRADDASDEDFNKGFDEMMAKRAARR